MKSRILLSFLLISALLSSALGAGPGLAAAGSTYLPLVLSAGRQAPPPASDWLAHLNALRALANLPPARENATYSAGDALHARYMVKNGAIGHTEDPANPWYTPEGADAARNADVAGSSSQIFTDVQAVDLWMSGPFHGLGLIDPRLAETGFGSYREAGSGLGMAAALDVLRGLGSVPPSVTYPVMWPADGKTALLTSYDGTESPDPLSSCVGFTAPTGAPIYLQLGPGTVTPKVTAYAITKANLDIETCELDQSNYTNPDPNLQSLGRSILAMRSAVVLFPRAPLAAGTYTVSVTDSGTTYTWSFSAP